MENEVLVNELPIELPMDMGDSDFTVAQTDEVLPVVDPTACVDCGDGKGNLEPVVCNDNSIVSLGNFFGTIQESVTIAWRYHLKTHKYSAHIALNEFYNEALDVVDDIIEQFQGINGIVEEPFVNVITTDGKDEITYLMELKSFVNDNKHVLGDYSELMSTVDNFLGLIDSTLYKLSNLTESNVKGFDAFCYEDLDESFCTKKCDDCDVDKKCYDDETEDGEEEEEE